MKDHTIECRYVGKPDEWAFYCVHHCTPDAAVQFVRCLNLDLRGGELQFRVKPD